MWNCLILLWEPLGTHLSSRTGAWPDQTYGVDRIFSLGCFQLGILEVIQRAFLSMVATCNPRASRGKNHNTKYGVLGTNQNMDIWRIASFRVASITLQCGGEKRKQLGWWWRDWISFVGTDTYFLCEFRVPFLSARDTTDPHSGRHSLVPWRNESEMNQLIPSGLPSHLGFSVWLRDSLWTFPSSSMDCSL